MATGKNHQGLPRIWHASWPAGLGMVWWCVPVEVETCMMSSTYPGKHGMGGCWDRQEVCRYVDVLFAASPFAIPPLRPISTSARLRTRGQTNCKRGHKYEKKEDEMIGKYSKSRGRGGDIAISVRKLISQDPARAMDRVSERPRQTAIQYNTIHWKAFFVVHFPRLSMECRTSARRMHGKIL